VKTPRTKKQFLQQERNIEIAALYLKGETLDGAGAPFDLKKEMVRRILLRQGITPRRHWSKAKPKPTPEEKRKIKEVRFWMGAALTADPNRCWEWLKYIDRNGYGRASWDGKTHYARHLAWEIYNNKVRTGFILDSCGNRKCINPAHLKESADKTRKNRG